MGMLERIIPDFKACARCGEVKAAAEFSNAPRMRSGLSSYCRKCGSACTMAYHRRNPERAKAANRQTRERHRERRNAEARQRRQENIGAAREKDRRTRSSPAYKAWIREYQRAYYLANREKKLRQASEYRLRSPEAERRWARAKYLRSKNDPAWVLKRRVTIGLWRQLKGKQGACHWFDLLDYSLEELRAHLERQFTNGMTWENMGKWHIDHIIPIASFNVSSPDDPEFRRAWALTNLRPLWAKDNLRKCARIETLL